MTYVFILFKGLLSPLCHLILTTPLGGRTGIIITQPLSHHQSRFMTEAAVSHSRESSQWLYALPVPPLHPPPRPKVLQGWQCDQALQVVKEKGPEQMAACLNVHRQKGWRGWGGGGCWPIGTLFSESVRAQGMRCQESSVSLHSLRLTWDMIMQWNRNKKERYLCFVSRSFFGKAAKNKKISHFEERCTMFYFSFPASDG